MKKKSSSAIAIQEHCWHAISLMPFFILFIIFFSLNRDVDWGGSVYLAKDGSSFIVNNRIIRPFRRRWVERLDSIWFTYSAKFTSVIRDVGESKKSLLFLVRLLSWSTSSVTFCFHFRGKRLFEQTPSYIRCTSWSPAGYIRAKLQWCASLSQ